MPRIPGAGALPSACWRKASSTAAKHSSGVRRRSTSLRDKSSVPASFTSASSRGQLAQELRTQAELAYVANRPGERDPLRSPEQRIDAPERAVRGTCGKELAVLGRIRERDKTDVPVEVAVESEPVHAHRQAVRVDLPKRRLYVARDEGFASRTERDIGQTG